MAASNDRQHLDLATLLDQLGSSPSERARGHLGQCANCQEELAAVRAVTDSLRAGLDLAEPPVAALARANALFTRPPSLASRIREVLLRAGDALFYPPFGALAPAGVRAGSPAAAPERVRLAADDVEVDLELSERQLVGQVARTGGPPAVTAWIERPGRLSGWESPVSREGLFTIDSPPERPFDLVIDLDDCRVRVSVTPPGDGS